jgi:hypothetical protein
MVNRDWRRPVPELEWACPFFRITEAIPMISIDNPPAVFLLCRALRGDSTDGQWPGAAGAASETDHGSLVTSQKRLVSVRLERSPAAPAGGRCAATIVEKIASVSIPCFITKLPNVERF